jgi:hypothetical protein
MVTKAGYSQLELPEDEEGSRRLVGKIAQGLLDQYDTTPSRFRSLGKQWYPRVQKATAKGVQTELGGKDLRGRKLHPLAGPGVVAAVSPNMDWKKGNIDAFGELAGMSEGDWETINASHQSGTEQAAANREAQKAGVPKEELPPAGRSAAAKELLSTRSIRRAPDVNLIKAHRILLGDEEPEEVITAAKTRSFMHNINGNPHFVTVDGRAHDMAVNQMRPWTEGRAIGSLAETRHGLPGRYGTIADGYKEAAKLISARDLRTGKAVELQPHHLQAILWEYGKHMETDPDTAGLTQTGERRKVGVQRAGQPYFPDQPSLVQPRLSTPSTDAAQRAAQAVAEPQGLVSAAEPMPVVGRSREQRRGR